MKKLVDIDILRKYVDKYFCLVYPDDMSQTTLNAIERDKQTKERIDKMIDNLPIAAEWIPCSERLPERDEFGQSEPVLITTSDGKIQPVTYELWDMWDCDKNMYIIGKWKSHESTGEYANDYLMEDVVAWMKLPDGYKEEGESKSATCRCRLINNNTW